MSNGTVKWFNPTKGYGFITPDDGGKDVFVHITAVERAGMALLMEGQRIGYQVITDRRGVKAVDLTPEGQASEEPAPAVEAPAEPAPESEASEEETSEEEASEEEASEEEASEEETPEEKTSEEETPEEEAPEEEAPEDKPPEDKPRRISPRRDAAFHPPTHRGSGTGQGGPDEGIWCDRPSRQGL